MPANFETPVVEFGSTFFKERAEVLQLIGEICTSSVEAPVDNAAITDDEKKGGAVDDSKRGHIVQDI